MAQTFNVVTTRRAQDDLFRNMDWWAEHHSISQAVEFEATVARQLATLAEMPERFGFAYENGTVEFEIRQMLVGLGSRPSYRAIYAIQGGDVVILSIRRGAQDKYTE